LNVFFAIFVYYPSLHSGVEHSPFVFSEGDFLDDAFEEREKKDKVGVLRLPIEQLFGAMLNAEAAVHAVGSN